MPTPFALTQSAAMVKAMAKEYGKFPTEVLRLEPWEYYLNLVITFPEYLKKAQRRKKRDKAEKALGYNPIRKLIEQMRRAIGKDDG